MKYKFKMSLVITLIFLGARIPNLDKKFYCENDIKKA